MTQAAENLQAKSILLVLHISKPGNRRKVSAGMVEVDADRGSISVAKELLQCEELQAILTLDGQIRKYVYGRSLPSGILKEGVYRLPLVLVDEVDQGLNDLMASRQALVERFVAIYPSTVEEARNRLRALYDHSDYPEPAAIRDAFGLEWRYLTLEVPETLSQALVERERAKIAASVAAEVDEIRLALRTAFAELVQHAADRLATAQDGKPLIFRDSLIKNMEEFFHYFEARNLTQDGGLASLVEQARDAIRGLTPEDLRKFPSLRGAVQQTLAGIKATMDAGLMLKPTRRFTLEVAGAAV